MRLLSDRNSFMYLTLITVFVLAVIYLRTLKNNIQQMYLLKNPDKPNFVFILTDDQDSWMKSFDYMKNVKNLLVNDGLSFENSFVASPLCCPSRSSILTGQYVHNHGAINNSQSGGCSSLSWQNGPEKQTFVKLLNEQGYSNFFAGKYLNQYGRHQPTGGLKHVPPGWDWWIGLEGNSRYYNYNLSVNGSKQEHAHNPDKDYLTNVIRKHALNYIDQLSNPLSQPFFMMLSTPACHAPFTPEPKYDGNFKGENVPRTPNFNIANDKTKHWLLRLGEQPLSNDTVTRLDEIYRQRLRTLLTVDDMVADVYYALRKKNLLRNTYIIFSSDNGYHLGQFSLPLDKREPYEFDVRVPLVITGPRVRSGRSQFPVINVDIAPTILDLAGFHIPDYIDGISIMPEIIGNKSSISPGRSVLIEHSGESRDTSLGCYETSGLYGCSPEFQCKCSDSINNTYACIRRVHKDENGLYCAWNDGEKFEELYDLNADSNQLNNKIESMSPGQLQKIRKYLEQYTKCKGEQCRTLSFG